MASCGEKPFFDKSHDFNSRNWSHSDTASFSFEVTDTITPYNFILTLRTSTSFAFSNLWVYVNSKAPDNSISKVAHKIQIANPDGTWIGRVSGTIVETQYYFNSSNFPLTGTYEVDVIQAAQQEIISNVYDISLRIESK